MRSSSAWSARTTTGCAGRSVIQYFPLRFRPPSHTDFDPRPAPACIACGTRHYINSLSPVFILFSAESVATGVSRHKSPLAAVPAPGSHGRGRRLPSAGETGIHCECQTLSRVGIYNSQDAYVPSTLYGSETKSRAPHPDSLPLLAPAACLREPPGGASFCLPPGPLPGRCATRASD